MDLSINWIHMRKRISQVAYITESSTNEKQRRREKRIRTMRYTHTQIKAMRIPKGVKIKQNSRKA